MSPGQCRHRVNTILILHVHTTTLVALRGAVREQKRQAGGQNPNSVSSCARLAEGDQIEYERYRLKFVIVHLVIDDGHRAIL